jgi:hypothetical protein
MINGTGFTDRNNEEICVGDKVRIYPNCSRATPYFSMINSYEGIVEEDNDRKEDRYRIVHDMGSASLAWECSPQRKEFIEKMKSLDKRHIIGINNIMLAPDVIDDIWCDEDDTL